MKILETPLVSSMKIGDLVRLVACCSEASEKRYCCCAICPSHARDGSFARAVSSLSSQRPASPHSPHLPLPCFISTALHLCLFANRFPDATPIHRIFIFLGIMHFSVHLVFLHTLCPVIPPSNSPHPPATTA